MSIFSLSGCQSIACPSDGSFNSKGIYKEQNLQILDNFNKEDFPSETEIYIDEKLKMYIDRWIKENNLNKYGDSKDTVYISGTPLFDEFTGERIDRYQYIIENHPELLKS